MPLSTGQVLNNRYRIVKLLGQGGFGAVYRAWDLNLQQPCALKENLDISEESLRQFEREARILSSLNHPNLPRVTDYFLIPNQGQYLVMDFVEGEDLDTKLANSAAPNAGLPEIQVSRWIMQVCDAISYLHSQNPPIIHRDIKPANIRITPAGKAVLVDFGIAKVYQSGHRTTIGARAATPGYSPPEQFGIGHTDERSDIYALGATTYHLLNGIVPPSAMDIVAGQAAPPRPLHEISPRISYGASMAVMQALEMNHRLRPASVAEFASKIKSPGPVIPSGQPPAQVITPAAVFHPAQAATRTPAIPALQPAAIKKAASGVQTWHLWTGAVLVILVLAIGAYFATRDRSPEATPSVVAASDPTESPAREVGILVTPLPEDTRAPTAAPTKPPLPDLPVAIRTQVPLPAEAISPTNVYAVKELARWGRGQPFRFAMSPDGQILAVGSGLGVYLVDAYTQHELNFLNTGFTRAITISADSQFVAVGALNQSLRIYQIPSGQFMAQYDSPDSIPWSLAFDPSGTRLAAGYSDKNIYIWEVGSSASAAPLQVLSGHEGIVTGLAYTPDGSKLVSIAYDNTVRIWNAADGALIRSLTNHPNRVRSIDISSDGNKLATADITGDLRLWDIHSGQQIQQFDLEYGVYCLAFSPDGQRLAAGLNNGNMVMIQLQSNIKDEYNLHKWVIYGLEFSPDGERLYSMSPDSWLRTWSTNDMTETLPTVEYSSFVNALKFSPTDIPAEYTLLVANSVERLELWDVLQGAVTQPLIGHSNFIGPVAFSPDGSSLASASEDSEIRLWDPISGNTTRTIALPTDVSWVESLVYTSDGNNIVATTGDEMIYVWDAASGSLVKTLIGNSTGHASLVTSPPGVSPAILASGDYAGNIWLWNMPSGSFLKELSTNSENAVYLAYSPGGEWLAAGVYTTLKMYDTAGWVENFSVELDDYIYAMAFSPNGEILAVLVGDGDIQLWSVRQQKLLTTLKGHTSYGFLIDFSPDGRFLASGSFDGSVRIWGVP